jgi:hypothetical protein
MVRNQVAYSFIDHLHVEETDFSEDEDENEMQLSSSLSSTFIGDGTTLTIDRN